MLNFVLDLISYGLSPRIAHTHIEEYRPSFLYRGGPVFNVEVVKALEFRAGPADATKTTALGCTCGRSLHELLARWGRVRVAASDTLNKFKFKVDEDSDGPAVDQY